MDNSKKSNNIFSWAANEIAKEKQEKIDEESAIALQDKLNQGGIISSPAPSGEIKSNDAEQPGLKELATWWRGRDRAGEAKKTFLAANHTWAPGTPISQHDDRWAKDRYEHYFFGKSFLTNYTVDKALGQPGGFGAAFKCTHKASRERYAMKVIPMIHSQRNKPNFYKELNREIAILKVIKDQSVEPHPNLLSLEKCFLNDNAKCLMLQYTMLEHSQELWDCQQCFNTPENARPIVAQLLSGFQFLHEHRIVHRDFKPDNMLVVGDPANDQPDNLRVVIIDFGKARRLPRGETILLRGRSSTIDELSSSASRISIASPLPGLVRQRTYSENTDSKELSTSSSSVFRTMTKQNAKHWNPPDQKQGEYGLNDLCIGVPVVLGKNGIESIVEITLSAAEKAHMETSATGVSKTNSLLEL